jgi:hypothetical protein
LIMDGFSSRQSSQGKKPYQSRQSASGAPRPSCGRVSARYPTDSTRGPSLELVRCRPRSPNV